MTTGPRRRPAALVLAGAVVVGALLLVGAAMQGALVYYRTPAEVLQEGPGAGSTRMAGTVVPGTVRQVGDRIEFSLSEGGARLHVNAHGAVPASFREGGHVVVDGALRADGLFWAGKVVVQHSNEYRARPAAGSP